MSSVHSGRLSQHDLRELIEQDNPARLDYEIILDECKQTIQDFIQLDPDIVNLSITSLPESDPLIKLLEVMAYRELIVRQQMNENKLASHLATASGADLERLAKLINPLNNHANDDILRGELLDDYTETHTAGTAEAYNHFAHMALPNGILVNTWIETPETGTVDIHLLFHSKLYFDKQALSTGEIEPERAKELEDLRSNYLKTVEQYLAREDIRPIGHYLRIHQASAKMYKVVARLGVYNEPGATEVLETARQEVWRYITERYQLGATVYRSGILSALHQANVHYILLEDIDPDGERPDVLVAPNQVPLCCLLDITFDNERPTEKIRRAVLRNVEYTAKSLSCILSIIPPEFEIRITHYLIYWGTSKGEKLYGTPPIATIQVGGIKDVKLTGANVPENATTLVIYTANQNGEMERGYPIDFTSRDSEGES